MSPAATDQTLDEISSATSHRFDSLRGVKWRINLGILPSSSVDELRRVTADSRRRYAGLRRHLLIDPHLSKDGNNSSNLVMDNPLSQNPDSNWGRFFRNAELEKMVDQDLSRLYPEHGSYFQTLGCQGMLRRILLIWCLRHPDCGYRQGMHELLAPLLYVLHVDLECLTQVRKRYEDHFTDKFDGLSFHENDLTYNFDFKKLPDYMEDEIGSQGNATKVRSLSELDPKIQTILLLSDAYGAEGELGIVLSEKFMEHDAYCMFDALMSESAVSMAEFFSPTPVNGSYSSLIPVIEASTALYHLLSLVDSHLHNHLVELGVEPQYFALRWLRVLFGREFSLEDLLIIWDEIFATDNGKLEKSAEDDVSFSFRVLISPRGAFISAVAVSMILYLRSSLLATENATSCLQRLLKFPENINLKKLIDKAKSLQALALETNMSSSSHFVTGDYLQSKKMVARGHSHSTDSVSLKTPLNLVPESYWEEKWRVLHKEEGLMERGTKSPSTRTKRWTEKVRLSLSRTESVPLPAKSDRGKKHTKSSVRRSLLEDLSRALGAEEDSKEDRGKVNCHDEVTDKKDDLSIKVVADGPKGTKEDYNSREEERCGTVNIGSEENSSIFSCPESPHSGANDPENYSEKSSVQSNISPEENDDHPQTAPVNSPLRVYDHPGEVPLKSGCDNDLTGKSVTVSKERKNLSGKFHWFWKLGRNAADEGPSEKGEGDLEGTKVANCDNNQSNATVSLSTEGSYGSFSDKEDAVDQNVMGTLRNLGQSMLEHIQVMESVFQHDRGQVGSLDNFSKNVSKGQVTAMTALKELRKISNILSEM